MKLNEIVKAVSQTSSGYDLNDFDLANEKQIGTAENLPIFYIRGSAKDPILEMYALKVNDQFVSFVVGVTGKLDGPAFFIKRTWTIPEQRNKGYMTALYLALNRKYHIKLVSDIEQSPETISVWKKLAKQVQVKAFDPNSKKLIPFEQVLDTDLYDEKKLMRLVIETIKYDNHFYIPNIKEGALQDYIHYTSKLTTGEYL